jgi:hypothetical protein
MLCCVVLCCVVLYCIVLYCIVLCCVVLCCVVLCCAVCAAVESGRKRAYAAVMNVLLSSMEMVYTVTGGFDLPVMEGDNRYICILFALNSFRLIEILFWNVAYFHPSLSIFLSFLWDDGMWI